MEKVILLSTLLKHTGCEMVRGKMRFFLKNFKRGCKWQCARVLRVTAAWLPGGARLPAGGEEGTHQGGALVGEYAGGDSGARVEGYAGALCRLAGVAALGV